MAQHDQQPENARHDQHGPQRHHHPSREEIEAAMRRRSWLGSVPPIDRCEHLLRLWESMLDGGADGSRS